MGRHGEIRGQRASCKSIGLGLTQLINQINTQDKYQDETREGQDEQAHEDDDHRRGRRGGRRAAFNDVLTLI